MTKFAKSVIAALSLSAALSVLPATAAFAAPMTPLATSAQAYDTLYTESSWMTLRVPIARTRRHPAQQPETERQQPAQRHQHHPARRCSGRQRSGLDGVGAAQ